MRDYSYRAKNSYENKNEEGSSTSAPFAVVEAYKAIRTNIMFLLPSKEGKVFEISSALPNEGKSSCCINLAIAFSQMGNRVLLIDGDLRKPTIHRKMHLPNTKGLSSALVGFCDFSEAISSVATNFDVLVSGPIPPNPSELLGSDAMSRLLETGKEKYDYIIIDTPPVNVVADAVVLAPKTEGIVMVVQACQTTHDEFKKAVSALGFADVKLLGAILNSSTENNKKYYRYRYRRSRRYTY